MLLRATAHVEGALRHWLNAYSYLRDGRTMLRFVSELREEGVEVAVAVIAPLDQQAAFEATLCQQ